MQYNFIVDSHCHLNYLQETNNLDDIINEANDNNVKIINNICTKIEEIDNLIKICDKYENVYGSVGIHPSEIREKFITVEELLQYTKNPKIKSIGETGLDYHFEPFDKKIQKKNFEIHIEASRKSQLPLVIHSRDCDNDMIDILQNEMKNGEFPFLLHCFSSGKELLYKALDLNAYISISGIITFKKSIDLQNCLKDIPLDKLLVETDAPYLAPTPLRGNENHPAYTKYTVQFIANYLSLDFNDLCCTTTKNFYKLFLKESSNNS